MSIRQYYYTSFVNTKKGNAGFQFKAMSPEVSTDQQAMLTRLIAYRIPPQLLANAPAVHPVALRYIQTGPDECVLLCSQSCGNDEYGRPGNFFSHGLILEPGAFNGIPPVFFWKSSFWRAQDGEERDDVVSLPLIANLDEQAALSREKVWDFLAQDNRRPLFHKLLCAVIQSHTSQRRIVILDTCEHVALWIAAVCCFLPPAYTSLLTFATYHHDVYANPYLITGTTAEFFPPSARDRQAFFILDAAMGEAGSVEASPFAEMAMEALSNNAYEAIFGPLITSYSRRFPAPAAIDEQLDRLALYASVQRNSYYGALPPAALTAISAALPSFEKDAYSTAEDSEELYRIEAALRQTVQTTSEPDLHHEYRRALSLLEKHHLSYKQIISEELIHLTSHFLLPSQDAVAPFTMPMLYEFYGEERVAAIVNSPYYLDWLLEFIQQSAFPASQLLVLVWNQLGGAIEPGPSGKRLMLYSIKEAERLLKQQQIEALHRLIDTLAYAVRKRSFAWLLLLTEANPDLSPVILIRVYTAMAASLSLQQRVPYRTLILPRYKHVLEDEMRADVCRAPQEQRISVIKQWAGHARNRQYKLAEIMLTGLEQLVWLWSHEDMPLHTQQALATHIIHDKELAPLPCSIEKRLLQLACTSLIPDHFLYDDVEVYLRYYHDPTLPPSVKAVIASIMSLVTAQVKPEHVQPLARAVVDLAREEYLAVVRAALTRFFGHDVACEAHQFMLQALYPRSLELEVTERFWQIYQDILATLLQQPATMDKAVAMLDFWFSVSPRMFSHGYPVQQFFLLLPGNENFRAYILKQAAGKTLRDHAGAQQWYQSLYNGLCERRQWPSIFTRYFTVQYQKNVEGWYGHKRVAKDEEHTPQQTKDIEGIFAGKDIQMQHKRCSLLYKTLSPVYFWPWYRRQFVTLMTSRDAERVLAVLSYWFDCSYKEEPGQYMAREFFLSLGQMLEEGSGKRGFRETMRAVREIGDRYPWFGLLTPLFREEV